jgi:4-hydroxy-tetrahydrodipicolinate synthase
VLAGASANSSKDVIRYCMMAEKLGVDGVMLVYPYYCRPSQSELYEHYKYVAEHVNLPIMVYNNPFTSGVDIMPETLSRLSYIDNIQYVKECSGDARRPGELLRLCGDRLKVFAGADDVFLEAFVHGATGWVCGSANVLPRETAKIFDLAVDKGNLIAARDYAQKMMSFFFMVETEGAFVQYLKAAMELIGRPMGHPRRPLLPVSKETNHRIKVALEKATARSFSSV